MHESVDRLCDGRAARMESVLKVRENLLVALEEVLERISLCEIVVGVSYSTTPDQLRLIPELLKAVVSEDAQLVFEAARSFGFQPSANYELEIVTPPRA